MIKSGHVVISCVCDSSQLTNWSICSDDGMVKTKSLDNDTYYQELIMVRT